MIPIPQKNSFILVGRIDAYSFQQAASCYKYLKEKKLVPIELLSLLPTDWEEFKQELCDKATNLGHESKCKGIVSDVIYDSEFNVLGPGMLLIDLGVNVYGFKDSTPIKMYQSAARTRYKKHLKQLSENASFVKLFIGQAISQNNSFSSNDSIQEIGEITLMLFDQDCPQTVSRFRSLVDKGVYNNHVFSLINNNYIQSANIPVERTPVPDECYSHHHDVVGMVGFSRNPGETHSNGNTSSIYITLENIPEFDEGILKKQAFGRVIDGMRYLKMLSKSERNENGQPILSCGIIKVEHFEI